MIDRNEKLSVTLRRPTGPELQQLPRPEVVIVPPRTGKSHAPEVDMGRNYRELETRVKDLIRRA